MATNTTTGLDVRAWGGGLVTYAAPHMLEPDQSPNSQNIDHSRSATAAVKRRGYTKHSRTFAAPSGTKFSSIFRWVQDDGTSWNLMSEGTKIWRYTSSAETDITGAAVIVADTLVSWCAFNNLAILTTNGTMYKWSGSGNIAALGGTPPSNATACVVYANRVWAIVNNSSALYYSAINDPEDWTTSDNAGSLQVDKSDGDTNLGLVATDGALYVFKRNSVHMIVGDSVDNFQRYRIFRAGTTNKNACVGIAHYVFFAGDLGVYMINGGQVTKVSLPIQADYLAISGKTSIALGRLRDEQVWVSYSSSGGANDNAYVLNYMDRVWDKYTNINARMFATQEDGTLIGGSSATVLSYKYDTGTNDDSASITAFRETKDIFNPNWHRDKVFKAFWVLVGRESASTITTTVYFDGSTTGTALSADLVVVAGTGFSKAFYRLPNQRAKFARFRVSTAGVDLEMSLHGWGVEEEQLEGVN